MIIYLLLLALFVFIAQKEPNIFLFTAIVALTIYTNEILIAIIGFIIFWFQQIPEN
jgi:hypothetical protein